MSVATVSAFEPFEPTTFNMAVSRINQALRSLEMVEVRELLLRDGGGRRPEPIQVCAASLNDWNRYVRSSSQVMRPKFMDWYDGSIWIVEYPGTLHAAAAAAIMVRMTNATGTLDQHLIGYADSHNARPLAGERNIEQDCAFGPSADVDGTDQRIPRGLTCLREFQTVKVEVGVSQEWLGQGGLNERAAVWKGYPGVEYVLLVKLSPDLLVRQYRLEQRVDGVFPENFAMLDIDASAILHFDAHRLLALPAGAELPDGFNDPVKLNLFDIVERIRANHVKRKDKENDGEDGDDHDDDDHNNDDHDDDDHDGGQGPGGGQSAAPKLTGRRRWRPRQETFLRCVQQRVRV